MCVYEGPSPFFVDIRKSIRKVPKGFAKPLFRGGLKGLCGPIHILVTDEAYILTYLPHIGRHINWWIHVAFDGAYWLPGTCIAITCLIKVDILQFILSLELPVRDLRTFQSPPSQTLVILEHPQCYYCRWFLTCRFNRQVFIQLELNFIRPSGVLFYTPDYHEDWGHMWISQIWFRTGCIHEWPHLMFIFQDRVFLSILLPHLQQLGGGIHKDWLALVNAPHSHSSLGRGCFHTLRSRAENSTVLASCKAGVSISLNVKFGKEFYLKEMISRCRHLRWQDNTSRKC